MMIVKLNRGCFGIGFALCGESGYKNTMDAVFCLCFYTGDGGTTWSCPVEKGDYVKSRSIVDQNKTRVRVCDPDSYPSKENKIRRNRSPE